MEELYRGRYVVIGPPGTGKTTFLALQVATIAERFGRQGGPWREPALVCSLTRAAAAEAAGRDLAIDPRMVGTLHSHCFHALGRPAIVTREAVARWNADPRFGDRLPAEQFPRARARDSSRAREEDEDESRTRLAEDGRAWDAGTMRGYELLRDEEMRRHRREAKERWPASTLDFHRAWADWKRENDLLDFTDLVERAALVAGPAPGHPWVILVDEAQDLSALEYELVKAWGEFSAATILVGDPLQCLYGFRGSTPRLLDDPDVPASHRRVLSQSYRVPRRVLEAARHWVTSQLPHVEQAEYRPRRDPFEPGLDYDGWVMRSEATSQLPARVVVDIAKRLDEGSRDDTFMVLATCSYMLGPTIHELRERGVPYSNPWRVNRGDWNPLGGASSTLRKLGDFLTTCRDSPELRPWSYVTLRRFASTIRSTGAIRRGMRKEIEAEARRWESDPEATATESELERWLEPFLLEAWRGERTEREFVAWWFDQRRSSIGESVATYLRRIVESRGSDALRSPPRVFVGTIHSTKGSEAGVVYVFPDLAPSAFREWARHGSQERAEIVRTFYVAMTRSQEGLVVCRNSTIHCAPLNREVGAYLNEEETSDAGRET